MHAFWWISNQCTGGKRAFCQKCPGAVRVLSAPGAGWKRQFVFQANQTYFSLQFPPAPRHHGNPLAKKRHFLAGKTGGFSLCSLGSRGINPLVDILGGLSFHQCPRRAEQGDVQAGVRAGITPRPPPIPPPHWPPGPGKGISYPEDTQLPTQGLTENSKILAKSSLQAQDLARSPS